MRWSRAFIPTLRENPADAESPSHQLLVRGGFIRQLAAGIYSYLPLGQRTTLKIVSIIRDEFSAAGAQEFLLPALHPIDLCQEASRPPDLDEGIFRLKDRCGHDLCLGMTHEEVVAEIVRKEVRSYRDLPQVWYQIQTKFRDEPRPKSGLLRLRQFTTKDSYSFDVDSEGLDRSYRLHHDLYRRIFTRCGLRFVTVEGSPGAKGGGQSEEFMVRTDAGEDTVVSCSCGYAANLERAVSRIPGVADEPGGGTPRQVPTPGQKTIAEIAAFLGVPATHQIKSLVYVVGDDPYLFLLRGDHQLNESKIAALAETALVRPARSEEIRERFGADAGSLGPVGTSEIPIVADSALRGRQNMTCGANKDDFHLQGVTPDVHFKPLWADLRSVEAGEECTRCGRPLEIYRAAEIGRIFKLGTGYSESMGAMVLNAEGKQVPVVLGSYRIGIERIIASAVELYHDEDGIVWPATIAPFSVVLTPVNYRNSVKAAADRLYEDMQRAGLEVLLDDRQERPGVKFKDADLIGIPYRIILGGANISKGKVELFERASRKIELLDLETVIVVLQSRLPGAGAS